MELVGGADGIGEGVGQPVVHRGEAGGVGVAEVGDLHGREPPGQHLHPVETRVAGEIDEDVGRVFGDGFENAFAVEPDEVAPDLRVFTQALAHRIFGEVVVVEDRREARAVEVCEQRLQKKRHRVGAQVGREKCDAQGSAGGLGLARLRAQALGGDVGLDGAAVREVFGEKRLRAEVVAVVEQQEPEAARFVVCWMAGEVGVEIGDGLGEAVLDVERLGAGKEGARVVRLEREHAVVAGDGLLALPGDLQCTAERVPAVGEVGFEGDAAAEALDGLGLFAGEHDRAAEVAPGFVRFWVEADGFAQRLLGFGAALERDVGEAEAHQRGGRARLEAQGGFEELGSLGGSALLVAQRAEQVVDLIIARGGDAERFIDARGLVEASAQMVLHGLLQACLKRGGRHGRRGVAAMASAVTVPTVSCRLKCS